MKLFMVSVLSGEPDEEYMDVFDTIMRGRFDPFLDVISFILLAEGEAEARRLAMEAAGDHADWWGYPELTACREIDMAEGRRVLMSAWHVDRMEDTTSLPLACREDPPERRRTGSKEYAG
jgi:hypothetical protein